MNAFALPPRPLETQLTQAPKRDAGAAARARAMARAFVVDGLLAVERMVLAVLLSHADREGRAWPLLEQLAARVGLEGGARSVARVLERLARKGLVDRVTIAAGELLPNGLEAATARALVTLRLPSTATALGGSAELLELAFAPELELPPSARAVLAVYALHASQGRQAWPSHARVARLAGVSVRTVGSSLFLLRASGFIQNARTPPGARLPNGQASTQWKSLVTLMEQALRQAGAPRPGCRPPPTGLPSPPDPVAEESSQRSEIREPKSRARVELAPIGAPSAPTVPAPSAPAACGVPPSGGTDEAVDDLLRSYAETCETDDLGRAPADVIRARLADGFSARDFADAFAGIALNPWRMALRSRRWVKSTLGDAARMRTHIELGRGRTQNAPSLLRLLPPPPPPAPAMSADERAEVLAKLRAITSTPNFFCAKTPAV